MSIENQKIVMICFSFCVNPEHAARFFGRKKNCRIHGSFPLFRYGIQRRPRFPLQRLRQFLKLWIGAGILPPRLTKASQPKGLTGMTGA